MKGRSHYESAHASPSGSLMACNVVLCCQGRVQVQKEKKSRRMEDATAFVTGKLWGVNR